MFELTVDDEIKIRTLHPDDAEELFALMERNRSRLRPWIHPSALPETRQAARIFTIECFFDSFDDPMEVLDSPYFQEVGRYFGGSVSPQMEMGIWLNGRLAGEVSVTFRDDSPNAAEFGYWLGEEYEGRGIVTRCVRALMDDVVAHSEIERFVIGCAVNNQRSRAIPERLGYKLFATVPNGEVVGEFVYDRLVYSMRTSAWRERV